MLLTTGTDWNLFPMKEDDPETENQKVRVRWQPNHLSGKESDSDGSLIKSNIFAFS